jgi:hypothetical protein
MSFGSNQNLKIKTYKNTLLIHETPRSFMIYELAETKIKLK